MKKNKTEGKMAPQGEGTSSFERKSLIIRCGNI